MNANYISVQCPEADIPLLGLAFIAAIRMIMPEVPAFHVHHIRDLLQVHTRPAWSYLVYAVVEPELIPAGIQDRSRTFRRIPLSATIRRPSARP